MALLFQPHRDRTEPIREVGRNAGVLLGLMAWAAVALGIASVGAPYFLAIPGAGAAALQTRFFKSTAVIELVGFAFLLAATQPAAHEWIYTGVATSIFGRAIASWVTARYPTDV